MSRPFRYTFILGLVTLATGLAAVGGWRYARASAPVNGPIVLISVDALRADHLPAYRYRKIKTPAIDQLAADGIVFEHAYSHSPQTLPAHASLLTGRLPFETGVRDDVGFVVPERERMLAEILNDRGFETGAVVSNVALRSGTGVGQGFAFFDDAIPASDSANPEVRRESADAESAAEKWLGQSDAPRRFLFLHLDETRETRDAAGRFDGYAPYDERIVLADEAVGRLLRYLKAHQLYDRTTIILLSDHGEGLGDHGEQAHGLFVYEEVLRVPLIVKQAAGEGAGRRVADLVQLVDMVPTVLDFAKAPVPGGLRGRSLKPLLDGTGTFGRRIVYSESAFGAEHFGWAELRSLTDGHYRYILAPAEELYDLRTDAAERTSLADRKQLAEWRGELKAFDRSGDAPKRVIIAHDLREQLAELGAVGEPQATTSATSAPGATFANESPVDPKDKFRVVEGYRLATTLAANREWARAVDVLQDVLHNEGDVADIWARVAWLNGIIGRDAQAASAFERVIALEPANMQAHLGAARTLLRLRRFEDARRHAQAVVESSRDAAITQQARATLANIALARRDAPAARRQAALAMEADATSPLAAYVEGRVAFDRGRYTQASSAFLKAAESGTSPLTDVHFYAGETLVKLGRHVDAIPEYLRDIEASPFLTRSRLALAAAYQRTGQTQEAADTLAEMTRLVPTPESFAAAAASAQRLGNREQAAELSAEARRRFAEPVRSSAQ